MIPYFDLIDPKVTLPVFGIGFIAAVVFLVFAIPAEDARKAVLQARQQRALKLWLTDCQTYNPIEACTYAWDNSGTLREIYFERAKGEPA